MIFTNTNGKLIAKKEKPFALEKDLQSLVENNLNTILGLQFVTTEFAVESYRFDSVAFDAEASAFVIIEYKRGKNESLVDQGYAYLYTLLNRKADFVLLFNETFGKAKSIKDFDWSQTRIIFISPQFTDYQKDATAFINMPFELYEIKQHEGGIISVDQINKTKTAAAAPVNLTKDDKVSKVSKEIIVYTENEALSKSSAEVQEWYQELRTRILSLGQIKIDPKKKYIAFKGKTNICDIVIAKQQLKIFINLKAGQLKDPLGIARAVESIGHWGNGDYEIAVKDGDSFDYILSLIKQAYQVNA